MSVRLYMLKIKHILQEKCAECTKIAAQMLTSPNVNH